MKRIQPHKKFIDAVNFNPPTNESADPSAIAQTDDIWYIDRVASETPESVSFELTGKINMQNLRLPKRQIVEHCPWLYRGTQCGYKGKKFFDKNDNPVSSESEDQCGHKYSSCIKRFTGKKTKVPFGGFLNARLQM